MGVWIEIRNKSYQIVVALSLPLWECGLKLLVAGRYLLVFFVTPFVGVWIEIWEENLLQIHK